MPAGSEMARLRPDSSIPKRQRRQLQASAAGSSGCLAGSAASRLTGNRSGSKEALASLRLSPSAPLRMSVTTVAGEAPDSGSTSPAASACPRAVWRRGDADALVVTIEHNAAVVANEWDERLPAFSNLVDTGFTGNDYVRHSASRTASARGRDVRVGAWIAYGQSRSWAPLASGSACARPAQRHAY